MWREYFIADAVVHGYNWTESNMAAHDSPVAAAGGVAAHRLFSPEDAQLESAEFLGDWSSEDIEEALFLEAGADLVAYHGTPIYDFWKDGHSSTEKGVAWKQREPERVVLYGAVNPLEGARAIEQLRRHRDNGADAVKIYAAFRSQGRTVPVDLDDEQFGFPLIEAALELGYKTIATHKAIPFGPVSYVPFGMRDLPEACARYPEMQFEVVHAGFAFVEETALLLASYPNVWLNLEGSNSLLVKQPRRFAEFLGAFLAAGGEDRILIGSGTPIAHARLVYDRMIDFDMPADLVEGMGYPEVTEAMKRKFLGENYMRLLGRDREAFLGAVAGDRWDRRRQAGEIGGPLWAHTRERAAMTGADG